MRTLTPPTATITVPAPRRAADELTASTGTVPVDVTADVPADVPVDVDALICPVCVEPVEATPPAYWRVADGLPAPAFSHALDRSALCRTRSGVVAEPAEARWWPQDTAAQETHR